MTCTAEVFQSCVEDFAESLEGKEREVFLEAASTVKPDGQVVPEVEIEKMTQAGRVDRGYHQVANPKNPGELMNGSRIGNSIGDFVMQNLHVILPQNTELD